jgi:hypothetical protein
MTFHRYWKREYDNSPWYEMPDTPEGHEDALRQGAMFFTTMAVDGDPHGDPQPNRRGSFNMDFDDEENPGNAFEEMRSTLAHLETAYGVNSQEVELYVSGNKGGHITIPAAILGATPGPNLHLEYKRLAAKLKADLGLETFDMSLYAGGKGKMFRLPNVQRSNGRYKVPITQSELTSLGDTLLIELTENKRMHDFDDELIQAEPPTLADGLNVLFEQYRQDVQLELAASSKHKPLDHQALEALKGKMPPCVSAMLGLKSKPPRGNFNQVALNLITYFHAAGYDENAAWDVAADFLRDYQSSTYRTQQDREKHWRYLFPYLQDNPAYSFSCGAIKSLGLPGNTFECRECSLHCEQVNDANTKSDQQSQPQAKEHSQEQDKPDNPSPSTSDTTSSPPKPFKILDWRAAEAFRGSVKERQFLVDGAFPRGQVSLLGAPGGLGKSGLLLALGAAVAGSQRWLRHFGGFINAGIRCNPNASNDEGNVAIYISGEDDDLEIHSRLPKVGGESLKNLYAIPMPSCGGAKIFFRQDPQTRSPTTTPDFDDLVAQIMEIPNVAVIIIDPLQVFCGLDLNLPENAQFVCSRLSALAARTGAAVILSHHYRKENVTDAESARRAIRGSAGLVDGVRCVYALWPLSENTKGKVGPKAICRELVAAYKPGKVVQGNVVKANGAANTKISTFIMNSDGILEDRSLDLLAITGDSIHDDLVKAIRVAAENGQPFTRTGDNGLYYRRHEMPSHLHHVPRAKFETIADELLQTERIVTCSLKGAKIKRYLDLPDGPFAQGEGEWKTGNVPGSRVPTGTKASVMS